MKNALLTALSFCALSLTACTKDNHEGIDTVPVTTESVAGKYNLSVITISVNGGAAEDITAQKMPEECQRDDSYGLSVDGSFTYTDEGTQCTTTRPTTTGTWALQSGTQITIDGEVYNVRNFNGRTLIVTQQTTYNGANAEETRFFTRL